MPKPRILLLLLLTFAIVADRDASDESMLTVVEAFWPNDKSKETLPLQLTCRGALLSTRFQSFAELKSVVRIEYFNINPDTSKTPLRKPLVRLTHYHNGQSVKAVLKSGVSETDFARAQRGGFWKKAWLGLKNPYAVINRNDLLRVMILSRRRPNIYREGDMAFYDLALRMVYNINETDRANSDPKDLTDKGFLNTFNHITSQVFMTSIFSENLADFIADAHERTNMPELITGNFTEKQINDLAYGPVDNYVDVINNEWGQELGKQLRDKYKIKRDTYWTTELMADYLNDIQTYYSRAFQIGFQPFEPNDIITRRFTIKLNRVMEDVSGLR
ncbi:MAG: hypothetical protein AB8H47_25975 [Bacteroidia bacterium]